MIFCVASLGLSWSGCDSLDFRWNAADTTDKYYWEQQNSIHGDKVNIGLPNELVDSSESASNKYYIVVIYSIKILQTFWADVELNWIEGLYNIFITSL